MRVRLRANYPARSSDRISTGLAWTVPPSIEIVDEDTDADLVLIHVGGRYNHVHQHVAELKAAGKRYAVLQLVLRATDHPHTSDWAGLWRGATLVWSYYDLADAMRRDHVDSAGMNLLYTPLGVEPALWPYRPDAKKRFGIVATGDNVKRDSLKEVYRAARRSGHRMVHVGPALLEGSLLTHIENVTDAELADLYASSQYVNGLRTIEGFELCAAEGLLCGTRPILFDRPNHRLHFGSLAEYIPEPPPDTCFVADWVREWLLDPARPVTELERTEALARFDWNHIGAQFWNALC